MREPEGVCEDGRRFVILAHEHPDGAVHYDLLVESVSAGSQGLCFTWSFAEPPADREQRCRRIFDHPRRFLTYEGPLREGLGRVTRHDAGTCQLEGDPDETLVLTLTGATIAGTFRLRRLSASRDTNDAADRQPEGEYSWQPMK